MLTSSRVGPNSRRDAMKVWVSVLYSTWGTQDPLVSVQHHFFGLSNSPHMPRSFCFYWIVGWARMTLVHSSNFLWWLALLRKFTTEGASPHSPLMRRMKRGGTTAPLLSLLSRNKVWKPSDLEEEFELLSSKGVPAFVNSFATSFQKQSSLTANRVPNYVSLVAQEPCWCRGWSREQVGSWAPLMKCWAS